MIRELKIELDNEPLDLNCRLHLRGRNEMTLTPTVFQLDLYSPSGDAAGRLSTGRHLSVCSTSGSVLATGDILDVLKETRDGHPVTTVIFSDGTRFAASFVSASFPANTSLKDIASGLLSSCSEPLPLAGFTTADKTCPLGTAWFGSTVDALKTVAADLNADVFVFRSVIHLLGHDTVPDIIDLNDEDVPDAVSEGKDHLILTTSMTGWPIGSVLRFNGLQGQLVCQCFDADTGEGPWTTRVILRSVNND